MAKEKDVPPAVCGQGFFVNIFVVGIICRMITINSEMATISILKKK